MEHCTSEVADSGSGRTPPALRCPQRPWRVTCLRAWPRTWFDWRAVFRGDSGFFAPAHHQLVRALRRALHHGLARKPNQAAAHRRVPPCRAELATRAARDHTAGVGRAWAQPALHRDPPGWRCRRAVRARLLPAWRGAEARRKAASRRRRSACSPAAPVATSSQPSHCARCSSEKPRRSPTGH